MGHLKARGVCSQGERLHFGRGTKSLRCRLRRVFGRKRKSRRHEAAGRRNSPEAVPNGEGGMEAKNEMSRTRFCGKTESSIHPGRSLSHRLLVDDGRGTTVASHRWDSFAGPANGRASPVSRIVESRREESKGKTMRSAGIRRFDLAREAGHFLGTDSARGCREQPGEPNPGSNS